MKNTESLKLNKDFKRLYYRAKSVVCRNVVVYAMPNRKKTLRLGLTCGKSIGKAVQRNRAKRLMREAYRLLEDRLILGNDIVLVARTRALGSKCIHMCRDMEFAFSKLGLIEENEKNTDCSGEILP